MSAATARHRAPRAPRTPLVDGRRALGLAAVAAVAAVPVVGTGATEAQAASGATWDRLALCESSGDWDIHTGNGYSGGLQFSPSTWTGFGGGQYAAQAQDATREEQIAVAEKVLAVQGWGAWPACSRKLGLTGADRSGSAEAPAPRTQEVSRSATRAAAPAAPAAAPASSGGSYTVRSGDTLARIAAAHGTTWRAVWSANSGAVADPDRIWVGQVLSL